MFTGIRVRPIRVEKLSEADIKYGITSDASAVFTVEGKEYHIPKTGGAIKFSRPLSINDISRIDVKLYMYDRQPSRGAYFTVSPPSNISQTSGVLDVYFLQQGPTIVFSLVDTNKIREHLMKVHTEEEMRNYFYPWVEMLQNKHEVLRYVN